MGRHVIRTDAAGGDLSGSYPNPTLSGTANVNSIVRASRLDQMAAPTANVSFNNVKITSLATPTASADATTKAYVDGAVSGGVVYKGTWNASTNTPTLADGVGTTGDEYSVTTAGTQNLGSGSLSFAIGDFVIYSGSVLQLVASGSTTYTAGNGLLLSGTQFSANLDTDVTLAANSDVKIATQKATKAYVDAASPTLTVTIKAIDYTILSTDDIIKVTVAGKVMTLPNATTATGKTFTIKNSSTGNITFNTTSSQTVDGSTSGVLIPDQSITVISDSSNWLII